MIYNNKVVCCFKGFYGGVFKGVLRGFEGTLKGDLILFPECLKGLFKDS